MVKAVVNQVTVKATVSNPIVRASVSSMRIIAKALVAGPQGAPGISTNLVTSVAGKQGVVVLNKNDVGLNNIDNTSDVSKPISTATQTALNGKEPSIVAGTTAQYLRGDKSLATLNTGNVPESSNLYFTDERVDDRVAALIQAGSNITVTYNDVANTLTIASTGGGSSFTLFNTKRVASSTATTAEKASADYVCDGTADNVEINQALQDVKTAGGIVELSSGTFNLAATLYLEGDNGVDSAKNIALIGKGSRSTFLVPASGTHAITLRYMPKPIIMDLGITITGTSDGIRAIANTTGSNDRRGFWQGFFKSLDIRGVSGGSSGWALNLENPFRSSFINIQVGDTTNGIWCKSVYQSDQGNQFNPGNCNFMNCQMGASGIAYKMQSADLGGFLNIMTFSECDAFGSGTGTIGWHFIGSTSSYFTVRDMIVHRSNVEQYTTAVKLEHAANIEVNLNYVDCNATSGVVFDVSSDSPNNQLSAQYIYVDGTSKTTKALNDANTNALSPTMLWRSFARVESGNTLSLTKTSATVLEKLYRDSDGTGVYPTEWQGQTTALNIKDEGTELNRGTRSINFTGTGVTATNSGSDITVNIPGGGGGGSGTVTSVSVTTANGVSGSVATSTTTPAITLSLGAITPTSVNGTTATEIGYVSGVTSAIQTQLNAKAPSNSPTLVTPNIGTPSAGVLTNTTGLPIATGLSGMTAGRFLTATSATGAATSKVAPAGTVLGDTDTQVVTNKDVVKRTVVITPTSNVFTINASTTDEANITTAPSANYTVTTTGTFVNGQIVRLRTLTGATPYAITWNAIFVSGNGTALPTALPASSTVDQVFKYNSATSKLVQVSIDLPQVFYTPAQIKAYRRVTAATTVTATDGTISADATSAGFNVTLPTASTVPGQIFTIKKWNATSNTVTVVGTIDGAANFALSGTTRPSVNVLSNGTDWEII